MSVNGQILGYESQWVNKMGYITPDEYILSVPFQATRVVRKSILRDVETSMPVTNQNPLIRFRVPTNGNVIVDFRRAKIIMDFQVFVDAPWSARPSALAWNIIDRWRLEQGGQYIEDRRFYNLQETLTYTVQTHQVQQVTTGVALYGDGSDNVRAGRSNGYEYILPLPTSSLTKSIYPWYQLKSSGGMTSFASLPDTYFQWELTTPQQFVEVYGAAPGTPITGLGYRVTRMQVEYEELTADPISGGTGNMLKKWLSSPGYSMRNGYPRIWFRSFLTNVYPVTQNTEQTITIDYKLSSLITIFATFRYTTETSDPTVKDKFDKWIGLGDFNMIEYQWEINNCLWPDKPVSMVDAGKVQAYAKFLEAWQMFHSRGIQQEVTPITLSQFNQDKFMAIFDGSVHPFSSNYINPISTAGTGGKIYFRFKFSSPPPANIEVVIHAYHWKVWNFGSKGDVPIVEN